MQTECTCEVEVNGVVYAGAITGATGREREAYIEGISSGIQGEASITFWPSTSQRNKSHGKRAQRRRAKGW